MIGRLAGLLIDATRGAPLPRPARRPYICPQCRTSDICCEPRPKPDRGPWLCRAGNPWPPAEPGYRDYDWHCHRCAWAARWA